MTKFQYFTYGSNMLAERLQARCPSAEFAGLVFVCGHELQFSKRSKDCSGKATIVASKNCHEKLYGALFLIDESERHRLDDAEGLGYERKDDFIVVKADKDEDIEVTTYFAKPGAISEQLKPYGWYKQLILWGAIQAELPSKYLIKLLAIEADRDLDSQRNDKALGLLNGIASCVFSKETWDMKIADQHTVADWKAIKTIIDPGTPDSWEAAFNLFFRKRVETRYFEPIRLLQEHGGNKGEGFSIVALQCSLIEFLASTRTGQKYKFCGRQTRNCGVFEYCQSKQMFIKFLTDVPPFKDHFSQLAECFYKNVRCALLHDARTKGKWKIHAESDDNKTIKWVDKNGEKILYRNNLQKAFEQYIDSYGKELTKCPNLQEAFIRKFDSLCED